jgi:carbon storage regulator CsrA
MPRLVLTRKLDQEVIIHRNKDILAKIKVSKIDRNQVRLTFEADLNLSIDRLEIFEKEETPSNIDLLDE